MASTSSWAGSSGRRRARLDYAGRGPDALSGVQLMSVGILGEYIGRVLTRSRAAPPWWGASWPGSSCANWARPRRRTHPWLSRSRCRPIDREVGLVVPGGGRQRRRRALPGRPGAAAALGACALAGSADAGEGARQAMRCQPGRLPSSFWSVTPLPLAELPVPPWHPRAGSALLPGRGHRAGFLANQLLYAVLLGWPSGRPSGSGRTFGAGRRGHIPAEPPPGFKPGSPAEAK